MAQSQIFSAIYGHRWLFFLNNPNISEFTKQNIVVEIFRSPPNAGAGKVAEIQCVAALFRRGEPINGPMDPDWAPKVDFQTPTTLYQNGRSSFTLWDKVKDPLDADAFVDAVLTAEAHPNAAGRKMRFSRQEVDTTKDAEFLIVINGAFKRRPGNANAPDRWSVADLEHISWND